jgi:hypothetical protein
MRQRLTQLLQDKPSGLSGGLGGSPKVARLSRCARAAISSASRGRWRIHAKQTLSVLEMSAEFCSHKLQRAITQKWDWV